MICKYVCVRVCMSVCLSYKWHNGIVSKRLHGLSRIFAYSFLVTYATLCLREIRVDPSLTIRVLLSETLSQTLDLANLIIACLCLQAQYEQATAVGLSLKTPGDDGRRGQVPSTVDRRSSPVDHKRRPACVQRDGRLGETWVSVTRVHWLQLI